MQRGGKTKDLQVSLQGKYRAHSSIPGNHRHGESRHADKVTYYKEHWFCFDLYAICLWCPWPSSLPCWHKMCGESERTDLVCPICSWGQPSRSMWAIVGC